MADHAVDKMEQSLRPSWFWEDKKAKDNIRCVIVPFRPEPIGSQVVIRDKYDYIFRKFRRFDGAGGDYGGIYRLETMDVVNETFCNLASSVSSGVGLGL